MLGLGSAPALAQDDPPGRVGRLADLQGRVHWYDHEQGQWADAERNRPLTTGDRLATAAGGRAELRVGSTVMRLGGATELEVLRLDDDRISVQLHSGSLALRIRSRELAGEVDVVTAEAQMQPLQSGHFRFDRIDDTTQVGSWRGDLRVEGRDGLTVGGGQRVELWREGRALRQAWNAMPADDFGDWVARDERRDERGASTQYVSPEMTGAEDLDRHGRWDRHPEYGAVWFPLEVRSGWAPYRHGRWAWVRPWGWTWVDEAPWGFAPFHYGRWLHWGGRWGWVPGAVVPRPVFAPALVAWVGGSNWGLSVQLGGPAIGWLPLAPREVFQPYYRHTPVYVERVNGHRHPAPGAGHGPQRPHQAHTPGGHIVYGNQAVPGAVSVLPRDALGQRHHPIARAVIDERGPRHSAPAVTLPMATPPVGPAPRQGAPAPGHAVAPMRPPHVREAGPRLQPAPEAAREAAPPEGDRTPAPPPRQRPEPAGVAEPRSERHERIERRDRPERNERNERLERLERHERVERVERQDGAAAQSPAPGPSRWATPNHPGGVPQLRAAPPLQPAAATPAAAAAPVAPPPAAPAGPTRPGLSVPPVPQAQPVPQPQPAPQAQPAPARPRPNEPERARPREKPQDRDPQADVPADARGRQGEGRSNPR